MRLLVLVALLAGCIGFGHCGASPVAVYWEDPALYDALEVAVQPARGHDVGIPNVALRFISFQQAGQAHIYYQDGAMQVIVHESSGDARVAANVRAFLENATTLGGASIEEHIDRLQQQIDEDAAARRDDGPYRLHPYSTPVDGDINATLLLARIGYEGDGRGPQDITHWSLGFDYATKRAVFDDYDLTVDAFGAATMEHRWGETEESTAKADVRRVLAEQGLPQPVDLGVSSAVC